MSRKNLPIADEWHIRQLLLATRKTCKKWEKFERYVFGGLMSTPYRDLIVRLMEEMEKEENAQ